MSLVLPRHDRTLLMTIGLPRSGKSTWVKKYCENYPRVSPDAIRLAVHGQRYLKSKEQVVWDTTKYMVKALFIADHKVVVLDATNTSHIRRLDWIDSSWVCVYKEFNPSVKTCIDRAVATDMDDLIPIIKQMEASRDPLTPEEKVNRIVEK